MGERNGMGDTILSGMGGLHPDDLVPSPTRNEAHLKQHQELAELTKEVLGEKVFWIEAEIEHFKFSIPESLIFEPRSNKISKVGKVFLNKIGRMIENYKGFLTISSHTTDYQVNGQKMKSLYEASIKKSISVMKYFSETKKMAEANMAANGIQPDSDALADAWPQADLKHHRVEFTLKKHKEVQ
jgi:flagellar motor protein MotB